MQSKKMIRKQVFDPIQRLLHWWIAGSVAALALLGWVEKIVEVGPLRSSLTAIHIYLGICLSAGFGLRIFWGLIGPDSARLVEFWRAAKSLRPKSADTRHPQVAFGYEPIASLAYIFIYFIVALAIISGLIMAAMRYDLGPFADLFFDEVAWHDLLLTAHNIALYAGSFFILAHIFGMIRHENKHGQPVAQSMISGFQYRENQSHGGKSCD